MFKASDAVVEATVERTRTDDKERLVRGTLKIDRVFIGDQSLVSKAAVCFSPSEPRGAVYRFAVIPEIKEKEVVLCLMSSQNGVNSIFGVPRYGFRWPVRDPRSETYVQASELVRAMASVEKQATKELQYDRLTEFASSDNPHVVDWSIKFLEDHYATDYAALIPMLERLFFSKSSTLATKIAADNAIGHARSAAWRNSAGRLEALKALVQSSVLTSDDAHRLALHLWDDFLNDHVSPDDAALNRQTLELLRLGIANQKLSLSSRVNMARAIGKHPSKGTEDDTVFETGFEIVHSSLPIEIRQEGVAILRSRRINDARLDRLKDLLQHTIEIPLRSGIIAILEKPTVFRPYWSGLKVDDVIVRGERYANRELSKEEDADIRKHCEGLKDKNKQLAQRLVSAGAAKYYQHVQFVPAILSVLHDKQENRDLRFECAVALGGIADRSIVDELIELLRDKKFDIVVKAYDDLTRITGQRIGHDANLRSPDDEDREAVYRDWKSWWDKDRDTAQLNWTEKPSTELSR